MNLRRSPYERPQQNSKHWILGFYVCVCVVEDFGSGF